MKHQERTMMRNTRFLSDNRTVLRFYSTDMDHDGDDYNKVLQELSAHYETFKRQNSGNSVRETETLNNEEFFEGADLLSDSIFDGVFIDNSTPNDRLCDISEFVGEQLNLIENEYSGHRVSDRLLCETFNETFVDGYSIGTNLEDVGEFVDEQLNILENEIVDNGGNLLREEEEEESNIQMSEMEFNDDFIYNYPIDVNLCDVNGFVSEQLNHIEGVPPANDNQSMVIPSTVHLLERQIEDRELDIVGRGCNNAGPSRIPSVQQSGTNEIDSDEGSNDNDVPVSNYNYIKVVKKLERIEKWNKYHSKLTSTLQLLNVDNLTMLSHAFNEIVEYVVSSEIKLLL